ncbi:MAG: hypothetical protein ABSD59_12105 [Terracidiphilus sp.]|jgi:hypothetical protein
MRTRFAIVLALVGLCFSTPHVLRAQRLYPVQGPATAQTPPPSFTAKLSNYLHNSGTITLTQDGGETFQGPWTTVTIKFINSKTPGTPASYPPQPNLAFAWDLVYGPTYFNTHILGSQTIGQATATGSNGTVLQLEFQKEKLGNPVDNIFGVAIDNKGNVYKVVL